MDEAPRGGGRGRRSSEAGRALVGCCGAGELPPPCTDALSGRMSDVSRTSTASNASAAAEMVKLTDLSVRRASVPLGAGEAATPREGTAGGDSDEDEEVRGALPPRDDEDEPPPPGLLGRVQAKQYSCKFWAADDSARSSADSVNREVMQRTSGYCDDEDSRVRRGSLCAADL